MGFGKVPLQSNRGIEPATQSERESKVLDDFKDQQSNMLTFGLPLVLAGAVDTIGQSVGLLDDGDIQDGINSISEDAGRLYKQNKEGFNIAGEVASSLVPILKVPKLIQAGKLVDTVLRKVPMGEKVAKFVIASGKNRADRIKGLSQELKVFKESGGVDITQDTNLLKAIRREKLGAAADTLKENVAIDLSLYGMLNESEIFFPSDQTGMNLALYTIPNAAFTLGSYAFTGRAIMKYIASTDGMAADITANINKKGINSTDALSRKGTRGIVIADSAATQGQAVEDIANAVSSEGAANALGRKSVAEDRVQQEVEKLGRDAFYDKGIDGNFKLSQGEIETAKAAFLQEPTLAVGVTSLNPVTAKSQTALPKEVNTRLSVMNKDIFKLSDALAKPLGILSPSSRAKRSALQGEMDAIIVKRNQLQESHRHSLETDGSLVPISERRWSVLDEPENLQTVKLKEGIEISVKDSNAVNQQMAFTSNGAFIQSGVKFTDDEIVGGINATDVIPKNKLNQESLEYAEAGLEDIAVSFSAATPKGNKFIQENELINKDFAKLSTQEINQLQESFTTAGLQVKLRELADADGLIPLYKTGNNITKVGHTAMDIKPIGKVDKDTIRRMVHVDDVVGVKKGKLLVKDLQVGSKLKSFQAQTFEQRTTAFALAQKFVNGFDATGADQILASEGRTFLELDAAAAIVRKNLGEAVDPVKYTPNPNLKGQELLDELEYQSIVKKQQEYSKLKVAQKAVERGIIKLPKGQLANDYTIATMLNLPNSTGVGKHPLVELFDSLTPQVGGTIPSIRAIAKDLNEVKNQMTELVKSSRLSEARQTIDDFSMGGNSLRFDKDPIKKPVLMMSQNRSKNRIGPDELNSLIEAEKLNLYSSLDNAAEGGAPLVNLAWKAMSSNPELFNLATQVDKLIQGTQVGRGVFSSRRFANRNSDVIQAQDLIQDVAGKMSLKYITKKVFDPHNKTFSKLASSGNEGSLFSLNQGINELRNGWDVLPDQIALSGGKIGLALEDTPRNNELYKQFFNRDLKQDLKSSQEGFIPMPVRGSTKQGEGIIPTAAAFDDLAFQGLSGITDISHKFLNELNFLRKTKGLNPINKRNWHVPYYDVSGSSILHITDLEGKTVNIVSAATEGEARRIAEQRVKAFSDNSGMQTTIQTQDFTERHIINSGGQFEAPRTNFGFSGKQTGGIKGKSASPQQNIGIDILQNSIKQLQSNFANVSRYTSATAFESEINYARATANAMPSSAAAKEAQTTIFDEYEKVALQTGGLTEKTGLGKVYYGVESAADLALAKMWDKFADFIPSTTRASMNEFEKFNEAVGKEYNPFNSFTEFLERTNKVKVPPTMRSTLSKMNGLTTNLVLRIFDPGMPLINFASVAAVSPAVTRALQRSAGEGFNEWKTRIGILGSPISETDSIPNTTRMMMSGISHAFSPEGKIARNKAATLGLFKQEVAEKINLITSPIEGYMKRMTTDAIDFLSKPTDWSEEFSRDITYQMFYGIGKRTMKLSDDAAVTFAHKNANDVVGDYRAANRPQIFQGATGMPFGLFTTWAWNFLQRTFGDIEGGRLGAVGVQAGMHSFLFGVDSMPGYETATNVLTGSYDGKTNIVDTLDNAYGSDMVDYAASGFLANIPKMFGASDGIAIGNRGSVGIPALFNPGSSIEDLVPSIRTTKTLVDGVAQVASSLRENSGLNGREITEILSTNAVNGSLKNIAQIGLGYSVDKSGQLVNADTRRFPDLLARAFELRTLNESRKFKEMARDRLRMEQKADQSRRLNKRLRSAMRGGNISDNDLNEIATSHFNSGGTVSQFKNRIRQAAIVGQFETSERNLIEAIKRNDDQGRIMRLMRLSDDSSE